MEREVETVIDGGIRGECEMGLRREMSRFPSLGDFFEDVLNLGFREGLVMGRSPKWERFPSKGGRDLDRYCSTIGRSPMALFRQNAKINDSLCAASFVLHPLCCICSLASFCYSCDRPINSKLLNISAG
jgi:hypothetical protein